MMIFPMRNTTELEIRGGQNKVFDLFTRCRAALLMAKPYVISDFGTSVINGLVFELEDIMSGEIRPDAHSIDIEDNGEISITFTIRRPEANYDYKFMFSDENLQGLSDDILRVLTESRNA